MPLYSDKMLESTLRLQVSNIHWSNPFPFLGSYRGRGSADFKCRNGLCKYGSPRASFRFSDDYHVCFEGDEKCASCLLLRAQWTIISTGLLHQPQTEQRVPAFRRKTVAQSSPSWWATLQRGPPLPRNIRGSATHFLSESGPLSGASC